MIKANKKKREYSRKNRPPIDSAFPEVVSVAGIPKNRLLSNMRAFDRSVDWAAWWEEFYLKLEKSGSYKYRTVKQFAQVHGQNSLQREFICYACGPNDSDARGKELREKYPWVEPRDWAFKRDSGGWYSKTSLHSQTKEIRAKMNRLETLQAVGEVTALPSMMRFERLAEQLDKEFHGRFFVEGLSSRENMLRAREYLALHSKISDLKTQALDSYAKSLGINFADSSSFAQLVAASVMLASQAPDRIQSKGEKVMRSLLELTASKASKYGVQLPNEMHEKVIDIAASPEDPDKKVQ